MTGPDLLGGEVDENEDVQAVISEARRAADWLTMFCCSQLGLQHGVELRAKLDALEESNV